MKLESRMMLPITLKCISPAGKDFRAMNQVAEVQQFALQFAQTNDESSRVSQYRLVLIRRSQQEAGAKQLHRRMSRRLSSRPQGRGSP